MSDPYLDISVPLGPGVVVWPGHEPVAFSHFHGVHDEAPYTVTRLDIGSHTGTHVDAPFHFSAGGVTVDQLALDALIGEARVLDLRGVEAIGADLLAVLPLDGVSRVILKTDNSRWIRTGPIPDRPAYLTEEGARRLVDQGVRLVGFDGLSIDHIEKAGAHLLLLRAGVVIMESVDLSDVPAGDYHLICLPLRIANGDGAPARAVLRARSHHSERGGSEGTCQFPR